MEKYWFLFVIIAAFSHAMWNFLLKQSTNKKIFLWSLRLCSAIIYLPLSIFFWPGYSIALKTWLFWGTGSIILHSLYGLVLTKAYENNDFTLAYPIARGTGPLLVVCTGLLLLKEPVKLLTVIGTLCILMGIYVLYSENFTLKETFKAVSNSPWPLIVGVAIACYTIFDKLAIAHIPPISLNVIENTGQVIFLGANIFPDKQEIIPLWKKEGHKMIMAGAFAGLAYIIVLLVLTKVPVSYVSPVRESSIIFGSLLGFLFLKEKFTVHKITGSLIILLGVILIIV